jgi:hypothetical protein
VRYELDFLRVAEKESVSSEVRTGFLCVAEKECVSSEVRTGLFTCSREGVCFQRGTNSIPYV